MQGQAETLKIAALIRNLDNFRSRLHIFVLTVFLVKFTTEIRDGKLEFKTRLLHIILTVSCNVFVSKHIPKIVGPYYFYIYRMTAINKKRALSTRVTKYKMTIILPQIVTIIIPNAFYGFR